MECSQDLLQLDIEIGRINIMRDSNSSLPVLPSPDILEDLRTEFSATPYDTEKWKKSPVHRKKATRPASLVLPTEEHPPRKRIKPTTVATLLGHNSQGMSEPSTTIGIEHF